MRSIHSTPKEGVPPRAKPMEPMEEGALGQKPKRGRPPDSDSGQHLRYITTRYKELVLTGINDRQISKKLAEENGRTFGSILHRIIELHKDGKIPNNPKRQEMRDFSPEEDAFVIKRYEELVKIGMNDRQISKKLAEETGRTLGSTSHRIVVLRKDGAIPGNPNRIELRDFTPYEEAIVIQRYKSLVQTGMQDAEISRKIAEETGRCAPTIAKKVRTLREYGKLPQNPKRREKKEFTPEQRATLIQKCKELIPTGINDHQISKKLEIEIGRNFNSITFWIRRLRKEGELPSNPNRKEIRDFTPQEEALVIQECRDLIPTGMNDHEISRKIGEETGRNPGSIMRKIREFRKEGKIPGNPNRREAKEFTIDEEALFIQRFNELVPAGLKDHTISKKLGEETGRNVYSIVRKIHELRKEGKIPDNPNRQPDIGKMSEEERGAAVQGVLDVLNEMGGSK